MRQVIVVSNPGGEGDLFLEEALQGIYEIRTELDPDRVIDILKADADDIDAVIIRHPSNRAGVERLLAHMKENNSVIYAIPALILTDEEHTAADEAFLEDPVVDVLRMGESKDVIRNRVRRAGQLVNSVSFGEFAKMLRALPSLVYLKDANGKYVFSSQYWHHLEHYDDPDWTIRGKTDMEIRKDTENAKRAYESDLRVISSGVGASYIIEENEDGIQEFLQIIKEPLRYEDGKIRGIIALINNVTEQERLKRQLEKLSFTDELTGCFNRAYEDSYVRMLDETNYPLSIISADCDDLKTINDKYGHMVGDEYIRMAVTLMRSVLPEDSVICRTGGDEFVAFLPNVDEARVNHLLTILSEMEDIFQIQNRRLSVSFGAATMNSKEGSIRETIATSDARMYQDKKNKKKKRNDETE